MPKIKVEKDPVNRRVIEFIESVRALTETHEDWKGKGVAVSRMDMVATQSQRDEVNEIGVLHGCHTCLTEVAFDKNQPWIGDHQPPTSLSVKARAELGLVSETYDGTVVLRPQCDSCSSIQAALVKRVNADIQGGIDPLLGSHDKTLIGLKNGAHTWCINASSAKVSPSEGESIQRLGTRYGCHSCGTRYPKEIYHADHNPPVAYTYSHVRRILEYARDHIDSMKGLKIPDDFELKPQCPRCSNEQGGKMSAISKEALKVTQLLRHNKGLSIPVYRD
jgi:hypothetical protein